MGVLATIDLARLVADFGCRYFVEFGTGDGAGIARAGDLAFEHAYSIEPSHGLAIKAAFRHAECQTMTIIHGRAERGWREVSPEIPADAPVLFVFNPQTLPERDLAMLADARDLRRDVLLVDDGAENAEAALSALLGLSHRIALGEGGFLRAVPAS